ncbi:MAG: DNA polymerase III subunit gamma/tau [Chloroflexi bacterium]|nr:DNA polymerase III subunit gamma/tau [Chloroflexota bacterium]
MSAQALYRRWRSQTFGEIIGQEHVTRTLRNALRTGRISHAYLFAGPRGTGKTTTARVFAKAVNCLDPHDGEPCNQCSICQSLNEGRSLDLIEIDAASNRGIDEIRDLREKIVFSPSECKYKVYVVDEVHMLTNEAFNALLKTLEEPPPHAIFILATTAPHRIPETVLSRCQRFDFRRVSMSDLLLKLNRICTQEGIQAEPSALELIARRATGSFRDAESLLDQLVAFGDREVTLSQVQALLGTASSQAVEEFVTHLRDRNVAAGLALINATIDSGADPRQFGQEVLEYLRNLLLIKNGGGKLIHETKEALLRMEALAEGFSSRRLVNVIKIFNGATLSTKLSSHPQLPIELAFVEASLLEEPVQITPENTLSPSASELEPAPSPSRPFSAPASTIHAEAASPGASQISEVADREATVAPEATPVPPGGSVTVELVREHWGRFLAAIREKSRPAEAVLRDCELVSVQDGVLTLAFLYPFHKDKFEETRSKELVEDVLSKILGTRCRVHCTIFQGNREQRKKEKERDHRQAIEKDPRIREAIENLGATLADVE